MSSLCLADTLQEIRAQYPTKSITIVNSQSSVLNPTANPPDLNKVRSTYSSPPTLPKLSAAIEKDLKALNITLVTNEKVNIPTSPSGDAIEWDGSFGLQSSVKKVSLASGKKLEADFVFVSTGNQPNVSIVEQADKGAIISGLIGVDENLRVCHHLPFSLLST